MLESMTGYGRADSSQQTWNLSVEIKSVNSRYCDINFRLPRNLMALEPKIRNVLTTRLQRGKIDVFVKLEEQHTGSSRQLLINQDLALGYSQALSDLAALTGRADSAGTDVLARFPEVFQLQEETLEADQMAIVFFDTLNQAIDSLLAMRQKEGAILAKDLQGKIILLEQHKESISTQSPLVIDNFKAKLEQKLQHLLQEKNLPVEPGRLELELVLLADKVGIDEELVRLTSHFNQLKSNLEICSDHLVAITVGKKLDFILQEINREVNTIGSKANDLLIANEVIEMKQILEKIREQVQNFL